MQRIASFSVDHDRLQKGMYVSRVDGDVVTYDIRMKLSNVGDFLTPAQAHTIEHLFATYARNAEASPDVVYVGPMGCRTGFYLLLRDGVSREAALELVRDSMRFIERFDGPMPGGARNNNEKDIKAVADAYMEAFPSAYKFFNIDCDYLAGYVKGKEGAGLLLDAGMGGPFIGERIAAFGLQRIWENAPVRIKTGVFDEKLAKNVIRWHVSSIDPYFPPAGSATPYKTAGGGSAEAVQPALTDDATLAQIGYRLEMRRFSCSGNALSGGSAEFSAWIVNTGNAPFYTDAFLTIRLTDPGTGLEHVVQTEYNLKGFRPGEDGIIKGRFATGNLPAGAYKVQFGFFGRDTGYPIVLGITGRISDGYYAMGLWLNVA